MLKTISLLLAMSLPARADDASWHFLSQTYGGTISLIKNLTKTECDFLYDRAMHLPATDDERDAAKRLDKERQEAREKFDKEHPGKGDIGDLLGAITRNIEQTQSYMITSGDIKTAECFR